MELTALTGLKLNAIKSSIRPHSIQFVLQSIVPLRFPFRICMLRDGLDASHKV